MQCRTCQSVDKTQPIFPESRIFDGKYWMVEHAYPIKYIGWFVIVLKEHKEALHEVTSEEFDELRMLQENLIKALHTVLKSQKEYACCFAEGEGFKHIHFHTIAVQDSLPSEFRGTNIFSMIHVDEQNALPKAEILDVCAQVEKELTSLIKKL